MAYLLGEGRDSPRDVLRVLGFDWPDNALSDTALRLLSNAERSSSRPVARSYLSIAFVVYEHLREPMPAQSLLDLAAILAQDHPRVFDPNTHAATAYAQAKLTPIRVLGLLAGPAEPHDRPD